LPPPNSCDRRDRVTTKHNMLTVIQSAFSI
jgi:hypothetical protein